MSIRENKVIRKLCTILYYVLPVSLVAIAVFASFNRTIWADESFSLELARRPFWKLIQLDAKDVHPPVYYLILRAAFLIFGNVIDYIYIGKIVSLIPYVILLIIGFTYIRKRYGYSVSFLFNLFIVGMPQMLYYAIEIRMYSWGMLFVTCAFLFLPELLEETGNCGFKYVWLSVFSALAAYMHYFACIAAIVIYIELFIVFLLRKNYKGLRNVILSGCGVVALYIPWMLTLFSQISKVKGDYWIEPITLYSIKENLLFLFSSKKILEIVILLIFFAGIIGVVRSSMTKRMIAICAIGVWFGTIFFGVTLSLIIRPIFVSRYVMGAAACLWLGIAIGLSELFVDKRIEVFISIISVAICCLIAAIFLRAELRDESNLNTLTACLDKYIDDDTVILSNYTHVHRVVSYYYPKNMCLNYKGSVTEYNKSVFGDCIMEAIDSSSDIKDYKNGKLIVLDSNKGISNETGISFEEKLEKEGYDLEYLGDFKICWYGIRAYVVN